MVWDELSRDAADDNQRDRDRLIGVYIGILAVVLAICAMGGNNASKEATLKNIEAANTWSFFQAKNLRRQALRLQVEQLEIMRDGDPNLPDAAKATIASKIAEHNAEDAKLTSDTVKNEGLDQLWERGKALEAERDAAMRQDPYFDYGEALLQIAIVLGGVAIISGGSMLITASVIMGALGAFMTLNGFTLLFAIPFIG